MITEEKKQEVNQLRESYRFMIASSAWQDFQRTVLVDLQEETMNQFDNSPAESFGAGQAGIIKGKRYILNTIKERLQAKLKGAS